jgi:uncharacterized OB-fold protein
MADLDLSGLASLAPEINSVNAPFWDGLASGEVRLQHCNACGTHQYPPESFCYQCGATDLEWQAVRGEGEVYSFVVVHRAPNPIYKQFQPYTVAIVQLDEGPRMISAMLTLDAPIDIGARVKPIIKALDGERSILTYEPKED